VLLQAVQEEIGEAIFTLDTEGRFTTWNRAAETLLGYREEEILGSDCHLLQGSTCVGRTCATALDACPLFRDGEVRAKRCTVKSKAGQTVEVLKNGRLLRDGAGNVIGGVETLVDITHLLRFERHEVGEQARLPEPGARRMVGCSPAMQATRALVEQVAGADVTVLIQGESGSGKEVLAELIHRRSAQAEHQLLKLECATLPENPGQEPLWSHARRLSHFGADALTYATDAPGPEVPRGTLLLDEVGDTSPRVQRKLLRMLQRIEGASHRSDAPGGATPRLRLLSTSRVDLRAQVNAGGFREDLFWRLSAFPIHLPPLRERAEDVMDLAEHFLATRWQQQQDKVPPRIGSATRQILLQHGWPGNCRELQNVIWYAMTVIDGDVIEPRHLPPYLAAEAPSTRDEAQPLLDALERCQWNRTRAAEQLGISRVTLWRRMRRLGIDGLTGAHALAPAPGDDRSDPSTDSGDSRGNP
jgi:PAS domain S-box-containing protein